MTDLKVFLVIVLVLKDGLGHLEDDVAVQVALGLGEDEDDGSAGGVDDQPQHDEHPVGHVTLGLLRLLASLTQGGFVAILDAADDDANQQTCSKTSGKSPIRPGLTRRSSLISSSLTRRSSLISSSLTRRPSLIRPSLTRRPSLIRPGLTKKPSLIRPGLSRRPLLLRSGSILRPSLIRPGLTRSPSLISSGLTRR